MDLPLGLGAILASVRAADRASARAHLEVLCSASCVSCAPREPRDRDRPSDVIVAALLMVDHLESIAARRFARRMPLRAWRAGLILRAMIAQGRPVTHDRGHYLCDDDTGDEPRWWVVGSRVAANDVAPMRAAR